jgi:oligogalacturonide transport system substrate-binding protein
MRKHSLVFILTCLLLVISGCNNKNNNEVVITFSWWGGQERNVATLEVIEMFERQNPEIKIRDQYTSWDAYLSQLSNQLMNGEEPDLMQVNYNWFYLFDGVERFMDMKELDIDLTKWPEVELDPITIDGKVLGLSISETGRVFYLNKKVYDEAGATIPTTWDELIEAGRLIHGKDNKKYAIGKLGSQAASYLMFVWLAQKYNKNIITDNKLGFTEAELLDGFRFLDSLRNNGVLIPTTKSDSNNDETNPNWVQGYYGGILEWNSSVSVYESVLGEDAELVHAGLFQINKGEQKGMYKKTAMAYAVSKNTKHKKEVEKFLNFILTNEEAVRRLGVERGVPSNQIAYGILEEHDELDSLEYQGHQEVQKLYNANKDVNLYIHPYYEDDTFRQVYELEFDAWLLGNKTSQQVVNNLIKNFNNALSNAMK